MEQAEKVVSELVAMFGPEKDEWWMAIVADRDSGEVYGDLALHLSANGHTAEIGYTLARKYWGRGYAVEALEALVEYLFEKLQVTRVFGMLHPDNPASAMVMERTGFLFEGHTKASYWLGDENTDDWIYGLTRSGPVAGAAYWVEELNPSPRDQLSNAKFRSHLHDEFDARVDSAGGIGHECR
ncbi:MAG: GNAT family N-acetyltransferase [Actinobacteria bacterium]|nr:GNAT family N-acetyltransferase [Actinomycetota bacterium]